MLAASMPSLASAQLARECFYVTELKGPEVEDGMLLSNLPMLMAMYQPGMEVSSVVSYQEERGGVATHVAGISLNLTQADDSGDPLQLSPIREIGKKFNVTEFDFKKGKPDRVDIIHDYDKGVCDVVFY